MLSTPVFKTLIVHDTTQQQKNACGKGGKRKRERHQPSGWIGTLPVTCRATTLPGPQETTDDMKVVRRIAILQIALQWDQGRARVIIREYLRFSVLGDDEVGGKKTKEGCPEQHCDCAWAARGGGIPGDGTEEEDGRGRRRFYTRVMAGRLLRIPHLKLINGRPSASILNVNRREPFSKFRSHTHGSL